MISIEALVARLPELEWKLSQQGTTINPTLLPPGLFRDRLELTPQSCAEEVKSDLRDLKRQTNERSAQYLALRIQQKINVLVRLCQMNLNKPAANRQENFGLRAISTRQQWLQTLHDDRAKLQSQQQAIKASLLEKQNTAVTLSLQAELGEVERRLTLAKETLDRATLW